MGEAAEGVESGRARGAKLKFWGSNFFEKPFLPMNKITCVGNLGRDAEVRLVPRASGSLPVVNFSLAVKIGYGESERTEWRDCSYWGERAQKVSRFLTRGKQLIVHGEPTLRTYPKKDGTQGAVIAIQVDELHFVGGKPAEGGASTGSAEPAGEVTTVMNAAPAAKAEGADVPF